MTKIVDLVEDYMAITGTVIVSTEIKNYSVKEDDDDYYCVDRDLCNDYPELSGLLYTAQWEEEWEE